MTATGIAALIAAGSLAALALTGVYLAIRVSSVLGAAATLVREARAGQEAVLSRANAAVDRASAQLDKTAAVSDSMDELSVSMADLASQVTALAGLGKTMAGAVVGGPAGRAVAVAYGVWHAVGLRRSRRQAVAGRVVRDSGADKADKVARPSGLPRGASDRELSR